MASLRHPAPIVVEPPATATATVIFLHGLGDTGDGWADIAGQVGRAGVPQVGTQVQALRQRLERISVPLPHVVLSQLHADKLRHVRFIFPTAPTRPVTINNGYRMPAWCELSVSGWGG